MTEADTGAAPSGPTEPTPADPADPAASAASPPSRSEVALQAYRGRLRRARIVYGIVVGVVLAAVLAGVLAAYSAGEISHVTLHTDASPPPSLAVAPPVAAPARAWRTTDRLAIGTPQYGGTVITYSTHTVGGRDARTGARTWSYTRTDRTVCVAAQTTDPNSHTGTTIAVFRLHGNCDEAAAFDSGTGRRRWTRTLDMNGMPVNGTPTFQSETCSRCAPSSTFLVTTDTTIYAINIAAGYDAWEYYRYGCRIQGAVLGSAGALISQTCGAPVRCSGVKFCTTGPQLLLRDGTTGRSDDGDNRDHVLWLRRGDRSRAVSAGDVISALTPGERSLEVLAAKDGAPQRHVDLGASGPATGTATDLAGGLLFWRAGTTDAIDAAGSRPVWSAATTGAPTAVGATGAESIGLATARITAPAGGAVVTLGGTDGRPRGRFAIPAPAGARVYPLGAGFLVGSPAGTAAYR